MLQPWERRNEVDIEPWEESASALPSGTPWKRMIVIDVRTNETHWFEVSRCSIRADLPLLCATTDDGGGNTLMVQFIQGDLHLRLLWFRDPSHRYARGWALAAKHADLWPSIYERLHCMHVLHGPWQEKVLWRKI